MTDDAAAARRDPSRTVSRDPWARLAECTPARIGLGRAGISLPTREVLALAAAHAEARDAVQATLDVAAVSAEVRAAGHGIVTVRSAVTRRAHYLTRPDLGRCLDATSRAVLEACRCDADLALVVGDGLSATAVHRHAAALVTALGALIAGCGLTVGPVVIATGARVALGDEVAAALRTRAVLVLIGERPGLSSPDSLGAYLTVTPRHGMAAGPVTDADRNCVSNIRPDGLPIDQAAVRIAWLLREAFARGSTGVALKDESEAALAAPGGPDAATGPRPVVARPSAGQSST